MTKARRRTAVRARSRPAVRARSRRATWAWVGVALTFLAVVAWFVVASVALDDDSGAGSTAPGAALHLGASSAAVAPFAKLTQARLELDGECKRVVVADDEPERIQGLRGRSDLGPYDGMLFVYDGPTTAAFTMAGVPVPLDIGFYDASGDPVSGLRMEPCAKAERECPVYRADDEFVYALETEAGGLSAGSLGSCPS